MVKWGLLLMLLLSAQPVLSADVFRGKQLYMQHCIDCHGSSGEGEMANTPNFTRGDAMFKGDQELINSLRFGRGVMPGYSGLLEEDELEDVVAYLRTFL